MKLLYTLLFASSVVFASDVADLFVFTSKGSFKNLERSPKNFDVKDETKIFKDKNSGNYLEFDILDNVKTVYIDEKREIELTLKTFNFKGSRLFVEIGGKQNENSYSTKNDSTENVNFIDFTLSGKTVENGAYFLIEKYENEGFIAYLCKIAKKEKELKRDTYLKIERK